MKRVSAAGRRSGTRSKDDEGLTAYESQLVEPTRVPVPPKEDGILRQGAAMWECQRHDAGENEGLLEDARAARAGVDGLKVVRVEVDA